MKNIVSQVSMGLAVIGLVGSAFAASAPAAPPVAKTAPLTKTTIKSSSTRRAAKTHKKHVVIAKHKAAKSTAKKPAKAVKM